MLTIHARRGGVGVTFLFFWVIAFVLCVFSGFFSRLWGCLGFCFLLICVLPC